VELPSLAPAKPAVAQTNMHKERQFSQVTHNLAELKTHAQSAGGVGGKARQILTDSL
jgi:hypothetical protein